ncbi:class I SAM-dependent methyltransferase, partial [Pseudoalteromonas undina]
ETRFNLTPWAQSCSGFSLYYDETGLNLLKTHEPKLGAINVDFVTRAVAHRRKFGGGKGQSKAKAVGLNKG